MAERFLASDLAVRLTPDGDEGRRRPPQWSTVAHGHGRPPWPSSAPWPAVRSRLSKAPSWRRPWRRRRGWGRTRPPRSRCWRGRAGACGRCWPRPGTARPPCSTPPPRPRHPAAAQWWPWPPRPRRWPSWPVPAWRRGPSPGCVRPGPWAIGSGHRGRPGRALPDPDARGRSCPGRGRRLPGGLGMVSGDPRQSQPVGAAGSAITSNGSLLTAHPIGAGSRPAAASSTRADQEALGLLRAKATLSRPGECVLSTAGSRAGHPGPHPRHDGRRRAHRHRPLRGRPGAGRSAPRRRRGRGPPRPRPPGGHRHAHRPGPVGPG